MVELAQEIIRQAQAGDLRAFEQIYRTHVGFVSNVVYRVVGNMEDAQEVTQDVFMNIYRKLNNFRFESSLKTWVYRISVNCAINHIKRTGKHKNTVEYADVFAAQGADSVRESMHQMDNEKLVSQLLAGLSPEQRAVIVLRSIEGLSYHEIAQTLKIPINTVRSRIKRARGHAGLKTRGGQK